MSDARDELRRGAEAARLTSRRQAVVRAVIDGSLLAFLIWGPSRFWVRLLIAIVVRLVYGAIASSARYVGRV